MPRTSTGFVVCAATLLLVYVVTAPHVRPNQSAAAEETDAGNLKAKSAPRAISALIVFEESQPSDQITATAGIAKTDALVVKDRATLQLLEAMFPDYAMNPQSDTSASWERKYTIYFDFPRGKSVRLSASSHGTDGALWSLGDGDFEVQGNLDLFTERLLKKTRAAKP